MGGMTASAESGSHSIDAPPNTDSSAAPPKSHLRIISPIFFR
jgi:hypothetical protein